MPATGTILIVDDEADVRNSLAQLLALELSGNEVLTASGGREALQILGAREVDVVLVDYRMPEMDGLELLGHAAQCLGDPVAIMITAYPSMELALRAVNEQHVRFFLTKPFHEQEMVQAVAQALEEHALTD